MPWTVDADAGIKQTHWASGKRANVKLRIFAAFTPIVAFP